jgi:hypothetical protein
MSRVHRHLNILYNKVLNDRGGADNDSRPKIEVGTGMIPNDI